MFADSLLDSENTLSRRSWTTAASFGLQALAVGALLLLPMIYTEGLPQLKSIVSLIAPAPPPSAPPPLPANVRTVKTQSNMIGDNLMIPTRIPREVQLINETVPPPPNVDASAIGVSHGLGDGRVTANAWTGILDSTGVGAPPPPATPSRVVRPSNLMAGQLIHRVQPDYPPLARQARIQGLVVLQAVISRQGTIENLVVLSGHPMLIKAAMEAVKQWRYRPYFLNGDAVEVETQVTVNFILSGG
jgi:periplasmic protein TonB